MEHEANTSKSNKKRKKHHRGHHYSALPYFLTPLVFVLISMIVVVPVAVVSMNFAVNTVHKAQQTLTIDYNDIEVIDNYEGSTQKDGKVDIPTLFGSQKLGVITCESAGLNTDVYYGINRISLRNGVALEAEGSKCGEGGQVNVYGYVSYGFKSLKNVEIGDVISFETTWGAYKYKVVTKADMPTTPYTSDKENLVLVTAQDNDAFSAYNETKLYVIAEKISGPTAKEVA